MNINIIIQHSFASFLAAAFNNEKLISQGTSACNENIK